MSMTDLMITENVTCKYCGVENTEEVCEYCKSNYCMTGILCCCDIACREICHSCHPEISSEVRTCKCYPFEVCYTCHPELLPYDSDDEEDENSPDDYYHPQVIYDEWFQKNWTDVYSFAIPHDEKEPDPKWDRYVEENDCSIYDEMMRHFNRHLEYNESDGRKLYDGMNKYYTKQIIC